MKGKETFKFRWQWPIIDAGFTLLELLIAFFISAIVLTTVYSSFFQIIKAKDIVENELDLYHEARVIFTKLTEDFQSAYPRGLLYNKNKNLKPSFFLGEKEGENSVVTFTSLSRRPSANSSDSDQAEISYYLEPIPNTDLYYLIREENPRIGIENGGTRYPISEHLVAFDLNYITDLDSEEGLVKELDSTQTGSLPRAVEVKLILRSPRNENVEFSSFILVPLGH